MPNLPAQTVVALAECLECEKDVNVKINKNGLAYYYCNSVNADTGNFCGDHHRWGKDRSQRMQREYLAARKNSRSPEEQINDSEDQNPPADIQIPAHITEDLDRGGDGGDESGHITAEPAPADSRSFGGWGLL